MLSGEPSRRNAILEALPGLLLCALIGTGALLLAEVPVVKDRLHLGALLLVILFGMLIRSVIPLPEAFQPGIRVAQRPVLRWGVALLGFRLSLVELGRIGAPALAIVVVATFAALAFGWWLGKLLGLGPKLSPLLSVGSAICGASAIVAAESVIQGERKDVAASLGVITLLGTLGIVLYPLIGAALSMDPFLYGVWCGASLHEMAQVVAAGQALGDVSLQSSTVVKLARIALLAPVVFYLTWYLRRHHEQAGQAKVSPIPWFLVVFLACVILNSVGVLGPSTVQLLNRLDLWLLCVGMAGVGLQTGFKDLRDAGWRAILVGVGQWLFIALLSLGLALVLL